MLTAMPRIAAVGIDPAAQQHAAGVDADADVEAGVAVGGAGLRRRVVLPRSSRARPQCTARSVSSSRDCVGAEGGEEVVAGVLQHPAACASTIAVPRDEGVVHHGADGFGVEVLGQAWWSPRRRGTGC